MATSFDSLAYADGRIRDAIYEVVRRVFNARESVCRTAWHYQHPDKRDRLIQIEAPRPLMSVTLDGDRDLVFDGWTVASRLTKEDLPRPSPRQ